MTIFYLIGDLDVSCSTYVCYFLDDKVVKVKNKGIIQMIIEFLDWFKFYQNVKKVKH